MGIEPLDAVAAGVARGEDVDSPPVETGVGVATGFGVVRTTLARCPPGAVAFGELVAQKSAPPDSAHVPV